MKNKKGVIVLYIVCLTFLMWLMFCIFSGSATISGAVALDDPEQTSYLYLSNSSIHIPLKILESSNTWIIEDDDFLIEDITHISTWNLRIKNGTLTLRNAELAMKPVVPWDINITVDDKGALVLENSGITTTKRLKIVMHGNASLIATNNSNISVTVLEGDSTGKFLFTNSMFDNRGAECGWTVLPLPPPPEERVHTKITGNNITILDSQIYSDRDLEIQGTGNEQFIEISDTNITGYAAGAGDVDGHNLSNSTYYPQDGALVLNGSTISVSNTTLSSSVLFIYGNLSGVLNLSGSKLDIANDVVIGDHQGYFAKIQINDTGIKNHAYDIIIYCEDTLNSHNSSFSTAEHILFINNGSINISSSELTSAQRNINLSTENGSINISNSKLTSEERNINLISRSMVIQDSQLKALIYPEPDAGGYRVNVSGDVEIINTTIHDILTDDYYYSPFNGFNSEYTHIKIADGSIANVFWYVDVVVRDANGRFVEGANISLYNRINQSYSNTNSTTDARGYARLVALAETMTAPYYTHFVGNLNLSVSHGSEQIDPVQILLQNSTERPLEITLPTLLLHDKPIYDDFDDDHINESIWYNKTFGSCTVNEGILTVPGGNDLQSLYTFQYVAAEMHLKSSSVPVTNITQMWGFGDGANWVDFSSQDGVFRARSNSTSGIENITSTFTTFNITEWHTYKIVRTPDANYFYMDGKYIARHNIELASPNMFLRFYSSGGNLSVDWINVSVDSTPPIFTSLYPSDGSIADNMTAVYVNYSDDWSGVSSPSVTITINGVDVKGGANITTSFVLYQPREPLNGGIHLVNVTVSDNQGNRNSTNWSFTTVNSSASIGFDTGAGTYPSIMGTHKGNFTPIPNITVNRMYTYPCAGTGGHSEYVEFRNDTWSVESNWTGYGGDWHYIIFNASFTLKANETYNYTIHTGAYPQIIHKQNHTTLDGSVITCSEFVDANGRRYKDWIPAIRLEYHK